MFAPDNLDIGVEFGNRILGAAGRRVDYLHLPTLDRSDDAYYVALSDLRLQGSRLYLGLIHHMETFAERLNLARRHAPQFGLGAYCGLGRSDPSTLPDLLRDHLDALHIAS